MYDYMVGSFRSYCFGCRCDLQGHKCGEALLGGEMGNESSSRGLLQQVKSRPAMWDYVKGYWAIGYISCCYHSCGTSEVLLE